MPNWEVHAQKSPGALKRLKDLCICRAEVQTLRHDHLCSKHPGLGVVVIVDHIFHQLTDLFVLQQMEKPVHFFPSVYI